MFMYVIYNWYTSRVFSLAFVDTLYHDFRFIDSIQKKVYS